MSAADEKPPGQQQQQKDFKKVCLICGCHTIQAINIYEPRSGPNIIELIQAKFKFQPANDDKFVCFSCNNWLINWHSLQVLNTKEESDENYPSGKSRLNNSIPEEAEQFLQIIYNADDVKSKPLSFRRNFLVRKKSKITRKQNRFYFSRHNLIRLKSCRKSRIIPCTLCGRSIFMRSKFQEILRKPLAKCKNCTKILKWRASYLRTLIQEENRKLRQIQNLTKSTTTAQNHFYEIQRDLVIDTPQQQFKYDEHLIFQQQQKLRNQRPLVDGKVVAMLRRLGTTLTREGVSSSDATPLIMSPAKKKPQKPNWISAPTYDNDEDILIDFNTVISEVLPMKVIQDQPDDNDDDIEIIDDEFDSIYNKIPKCCTISVINVDKH